MGRLARVGGERRGSRPSASAGQGLVEFAVILPVFLLILMILFDFGRVVYAQNTITNNARTAVRAASVDARFSLDKYAQIREAARRMSPLVPVADIHILGAPGDCDGVVDVVDGNPTEACFYPDGPDGAGNPTAGDSVEVNLSVSVPLITPVVSSVLGGSVALTARSVGFVHCSGC
jgi:Flp pilus assembly protein TadG